MTLTYAMDPNSAGADAFHDVSHKSPSKARKGAAAVGTSCSAIVRSPVRISPRTLRQREVERETTSVGRRRRMPVVQSLVSHSDVVFNAATGQMMHCSAQPASEHSQANVYARPRPQLPSLVTTGERRRRDRAVGAASDAVTSSQPLLPSDS